MNVFGDTNSYFYQHEMFQKYVPLLWAAELLNLCMQKRCDNPTMFWKLWILLEIMLIILMVNPCTAVQSSVWGYLNAY